MTNSSDGGSRIPSYLKKPESKPPSPGVREPAAPAAAPAGGGVPSYLRKQAPATTGTAAGPVIEERSSQTQEPERAHGAPVTPPITPTSRPRSNETAAVNRRELVYCAIVGLVAGLIAWVPIELRYYGRDHGDMVVLVFAAALMAALIATATHSARFGRGALRRFAGAFVLTALAVVPIVMSMASMDTLLAQGVLSRIVYWALESASIAVAVAFVSGAWRRSPMFLVCGLVGGAAAGALFDPLADFLILSGLLGAANSGLAVRLIGQSLEGLYAALAVGIAVEVTKDAWFTFDGGPLSGRQFRLATSTSILGRSERADIALFGDTAVEAQHVEVTRQGRQYALRALVPDKPPFVNGAPVSAIVVSDGDRIQIGAHTMRFGARREGTLAATPRDLVLISLPAIVAVLLAAALTAYNQTLSAPDSIELTQSRAEAGDMSARWNLCIAYLEGRNGVVADAGRAAPWCRLAAEQGYPDAQYAWGLILKDGRGGVPADPASARDWLRRAIDGGAGEARLELALMLGDGVGGPADPAAARTLLQQASAEGHVYAKYLLALQYAQGVGGDPNEQAAFQLMTEAAAADDLPMARWSLGTMYADGLGTTPDINRACELFRRAYSEIERKRLATGDTLNDYREQLSRTCP